MYQCIDLYQKTILTEEIWKKYFDMEILFDNNSEEEINFENYSQFKEHIKKELEDRDLKIIIIHNNENFIGRLKMYSKKSEILIHFDCNLLIYCSEIISLIKHQIIDFKNNNQKIIFETNDNKLLGLIDKLGGELNNAITFMTIKKENINQNILNKWLREISLKNSKFKMKIYKSIPQVDLYDYCNLLSQLLNEIGETYNITTPEKIKNNYKWFYENNIIPYCIVIFNENNEIIGLSNSNIYSNACTTCQQLITGIKKEYRNLGLCKWLKAEMFKEILKDYPAIEEINTDTSYNNWKMKKINKLIGFKVDYSKYTYNLNFE